MKPSRLVPTKMDAFTAESPCCRLTHIESAPLAATMELSRTHGPRQGAALMKGTTKHVALDAHEATTVGLVREESGRVIARSVVPTDGPNGLRWRLRAHTGLGDRRGLDRRHG